MYVQLYGAEGKGEVVYLDNKSDNFERGLELFLKYYPRLNTRKYFLVGYTLGT